MPWRNGRGETVEIFRFPSEQPLFDWRISRAVIAEEGPFSNFSGYDRHLVVLSGAGVKLSHGDGREETLKTHETAIFSGDETTHALLLDGPVADFNVMVRREFGTAWVQVVTDTEGFPLKCSSGALMVYALNPCLVAGQKGTRIDLDQDESLLLSSSDGLCLLSASMAIVIQITPLMTG